MPPKSIKKNKKKTENKPVKVHKDSNEAIALLTTAATRETLKAAIREEVLAETATAPEEEPQELEVFVEESDVLFSYSIQLNTSEGELSHIEGSVTLHNVLGGDNNLKRNKLLNRVREVIKAQLEAPVCSDVEAAIKGPDTGVESTQGLGEAIVLEAAEAENTPIPRGPATEPEMILEPDA